MVTGSILVKTIMLKIQLIKKSSDLISGFTENKLDSVPFLVFNENVSAFLTVSHRAPIRRSGIARAYFENQHNAIVQFQNNLVVWSILVLLKT